MNVDTGELEALRGEVADLRAEVERLQARAEFDRAGRDLAFYAGVETGENRARRALGLPSAHRPAAPAPARVRHLRPVDGSGR